MFLRSLVERLRNRPMVRPWALAVPILVLLIALPMLRPLRQPTRWEMSNQEQARLATIQALVEHGTLAIDQTLYNDIPDTVVNQDREHFSPQPPMLSVLLAGPYWIMHHYGWTLQRDLILVTYLLTLLGATLPVALSAGLIYRMGRLFELRRPWRTFLAAAVVLGSGLISYAVVLNAHAPAAFGILCAAACLAYVSMSQRPGVLWIAAAGFCGAMAAAIDPPAAIFPLLFIPVILTLRRGWVMRAAGLGLYVLAALPVLALHLTLTHPMTGSLLPTDWTGARIAQKTADDIAPQESPYPDDEDPALQRTSRMQTVWAGVNDLSDALFGAHGAVSHFPILLIAILGTGAIMHRHWPTSTKMLAVATLAGSGVIVLACAYGPDQWMGNMFAAGWYIIFLPLLIFWGGAWLRRSHGVFAWSTAGVLLAFSVTVSLIGATGPCPREGFQGYTAAAALQRLIHTPSATVPHTALAGEQGW